MIEAMKGVPPTEFTQPAPIESLADRAKREERGGFDLGGRLDAPGIPGGMNYYPSAPLPGGRRADHDHHDHDEEPTTTTTTEPPRRRPRPPPSTTTTTFGFRRTTTTDPRPLGRN